MANFLLIFVLFTKACLADKETLKALRTNGIVPDVISKVPPSLMYVNFGSERSEGGLIPVSYGNVVQLNQTIDSPSFIGLENANPEKSYALMLVDPDPPTKNLPFLGHILHWMVVNVPGNDTNDGETLVEYIKPNPPPLTGLHRFVFLMYEQPYRKMHFDKRDYPSGSLYSRLRFKTAYFANKYNFGDPVAANFFKTQWQWLSRPW